MKPSRQESLLRPSFQTGHGCSLLELLSFRCLDHHYSEHHHHHRHYSDHRRHRHFYQYRHHITVVSSMDACYSSIPNQHNFHDHCHHYLVDLLKSTVSILQGSTGLGEPDRIENLGDTQVGVDHHFMITSSSPSLSPPSTSSSPWPSCSCPTPSSWITSSPSARTSSSMFFRTFLPKQFCHYGSKYS